MAPRKRQMPKHLLPKEKPEGPAPSQTVFPAGPIPARQMNQIPPMTNAEYLALKSLASGTANSDQQVRALKLIVNSFADYGGVSTDPTEALVHAGRRFVGVCIVQTLNRDFTGE